MTDADATGTELAEIEGTMRDDYREYARSPVMQGRYLELLDARNSGEAPPPADGISAEMATIKERIRNDNAGYQADPVMQARFLELLTAQETGAEPSGDAETVRDAIMGTDVALADYRSSNRVETVDTLSGPSGKDFKGNMQALNSAAIEVVQDIGEQEGAENFLHGFDVLTDRVQASVFKVMLAPAFNERAATSDEMATFNAEDDAAPALMREWGANAARRKGIAGARLARMFDGLDDGETRELEHFITSAPVAEWTAMLRQLSNPEAVTKRPKFKAMKGAV